MRALALTMDDPEVVILMTDLAADYEKLADRVAAKKSPASPPQELPRVEASVQGRRTDRRVEPSRAWQAIIGVAILSLLLVLVIALPS